MTQKGTVKTRVAVNDRGYRIGETHHRAKLSDAEIEAILYLHDAGLSFGAIAAKWDEPGRQISKSTVRDVVHGARRAQVPARYKDIDR